MATLNEGLTIGDVLKAELETPRNYCREVCVLAQDEAAEDDLEIGQALETDTGQKIVLATGANADSILLEKVTAEDLAADDVSALCLVRGPAVVDGNNLTIANGEETDALAALKGLGILNSASPTYVV